MWRELRPVAIAYSGGTSSRWVVEATIRGEIPRPARLAVFFADTGAEHSWTYDDVDEVEELCRRAGVPFVRARRPGDSLFEHVMRSVETRSTRMDHPPLWVQKDGGDRGKLEQRCTREWKERTLRRAQSKWLESIGASKRSGMITWIGFGADEVGRAQSAIAKAQKNAPKWAVDLDFPAIRRARAREQQRADLVAENGHAPKFSMCTFCPYKSPARWRETNAADFSEAQQMDDAIRDLSFMDVTEGDCFLSDRLVSITRAKELADDDSPELPCASGLCFT